MQKFYSRNLLFSKRFHFVAAFFVFTTSLWAQPRLFNTQFSNESGSGGSADYSSGYNFEGAAFGTHRLITAVSANGDAFFRFRNSANTQDRRPGTDGDFIPLNDNAPYTSIFDGAFNAFRFTATTGRRYVFKTDAAVNNVAIMEIQGTNVETISFTSRSPAGTVYPGLDVTITATVSGTFSTGQAAWLRYTNDGFATSTVVKMTGGTTQTAVIPGSANTPSSTIEYYVFTSGDFASIAPANADLLTINGDNNSGSNYNYATPAGWIVDVTGSWGTGTTWVGGNIPPTNANMGSITYDATNSTLTLNQDAIISSINIATSKVFTGSDGSPRTLTLTGGGAFTRVGAFTPTTNNTTIFDAGGTISALTTWQNLQVSSGTLTPTGVQTIIGTFQINTGGTISIGPTYGAASALIYNTGGSYGISNEWTSTATTGAAGAGRPNDVFIQGAGTTLNMTTTNRGLARDLIIDAGATLNLNGTSGDLYLQRNWNNSGTFNPNGRAVGFTGISLSSTITNAAGETFDYLIVSKTTSGNLILNNNVTVAANTGDVLQFGSNLTNIGSIDLGGNTITINGAGGNIFLGAGTALARNITGTGNFIVSGAKTVTRTTTNALIFAVGVTVQLSTSLTLSAASISTINGTLQINSGGSVVTNPPVYGAASSLVYNTGGGYGVSIEWTSTLTAGLPGAGRPNDVVIQGAGTTLNMTTTNRGLARDLTIDVGATLNLNGTSGDLYLQRNWSNAGTFNPNGRAVGFTGISLSSTITNAAGETFDYLIVSKTTSGNLILNNDVTVAANAGNVLQFGSNLTNIGSIDLGGNTLTINGAGGNIFLGVGTALARNIIGTGNFIVSGAKTVTRTTTNTLIFAVGVTVQLSTSLTLSAASISTINGTLQINSGGSVVTNPPVYGASSMLIYNQGGSLNTGVEWTITTGGAAALGRPADVTLDNSTTLELTAARGMARDLVVKTGSVLILNATTGSITVGRSWTRETGSTFTHNGRLTTLGLVTSSGVIDVVGGEDFGPLTISKGAATSYITMNNDVVVNGTFTMVANGGRFLIGSNTLTLNGNALTTVNTGTISGTSNSNLIVNGSAASCTLAFTIAVAENQLGSLTINRTGPGTVNLASNLLIDNNSGLNNSVLTLTTGWLQVNVGFTLTVANTTSSGSANSFVFTQTTGRMAYSVTGAGSNNLSYPIGSAANVNSYRPLLLNNLLQSGDNTYAVAATIGAASILGTTYNSPILAMSTVRYYPFAVGNGANLTSIASVSLTSGADDNPSGVDNQTIGEFNGGSWDDIGATGGSLKTSSSASTTSTGFAFGFTTLTLIYVNQAIGNDLNSGQNAANSPVGSGPKQTFNAAMTSVTNGGTVSYTGGSTIFAAQTWDIDKNINLTQTGLVAATNLANVTINVLNKAVMPFTASEVNSGTDRITITAHQLVTGMAIQYNNYGQAFGFMPSGINVGTDVLTVGGNIATGQQVIYQAYPSSGEAGGLTHGTTYYAINVSGTTISLAASYANALSNTLIDITSAGTAESHGVIASVPEGLTGGTTYFAIVTDANTIQLATTNPDALDGNAIDLITAGRGNHVLVFTPVLAGILSFKNPINITGVQALIDPFTLLVTAAGTINIGPGTYNMQPTIQISKLLNLVGDGIGSTILSGGGKISSANSYFGITYPTIALAACTLMNFSVTGYYNGINRNSALANTGNVIEAVESSDNFNRGLNWEGSGAITTALTIRNSVFSNNNGVGVNSTGIYINGMTKVGLNIRNNTCIGNRNSGIEIGPTGLATNFFIKGNTVTGVNAISPLQNSITEFGIIVANASPTGANSHIADNAISIYGRAGIECRGCVGNTNTSGNGSFRIAGNYINQLGGPFRVEPNTALQNDIRDIAGIAVGSMEGSALSSGIAIDTNQIESLQQPFSATTAYTAFGIVSAGTNIVHRRNIVTGCEIGIQPQEGASGNENNTPDDFYGRDNTATTTGFLANRNSITGNTDFSARNQIAGTANFMGNWWGHENGPTHASNTNSGLPGFGAGAGEILPTGTTIAYNGHMSENPDDVAGTASGERGIQSLTGKRFRLKPTANSVQLSGAGTNYIINQGLVLGQSSGPTVTATDNITDTLDIAPITWTLPSESIKIRKRMYLRGNFGTGTLPIIAGTGSSVHNVEQSGNARMMINVASQNSGIEYLEVRVNVPFLVFGVSNLIGIGDTVSTAASVLNNYTIKNNNIRNIGSYNFFSFGLYVKSLNFSNDPSIVTITGNEIGSPGSDFGAPIRIWSCRGTVANNTLTGFYSLRWGTPAVGTGTSEIYGNTFIGSVELNSPQASSVLNVYNNTFNRNGTRAHPQGIEIRLNRIPTAFVNIYDNTFNNIGQGGYPYWGVLSLRCQNVSITNNIFNAHSTATDFQFIHASTRQQGTLANATDNFDNSISVKGNQFIGNASGGTNKVGIQLARHRSNQTFGTIEIGGPGADANTFSGLSRYFELDPFTGNFSAFVFPSPYSSLTGTPDSPVVPMDVNFDASENIYEVSGGDKLPVNMTKAELIELEDKVQHAVDYIDLGFVTLKPQHVTITTNSFLNPYTLVKSFGRGMAQVSDGWSVLSQAGIFSESVTVANDLTFQSTGTTTLQNLTMNGTGKTLTIEDNHNVTNVVTLTDGIVETGATSELFVENTAAAAVVGGTNTAHINGNLRRAIATGIFYDFPVGNGTVEELMSMNFTSVSGLNDVNVRFTNTAPGTNFDNFTEFNGQFSEILQSGYWIVDPNSGGSSNNYEMRLRPVNFTDFPLGKAAYSIVKRVGAGNWAKDGTISNPDFFNQNNGVWPDGTLRRTGMNGFSNFGVGSSPLVPLPLSLVAFDAQLRSGKAVVTWQVVKEDENTTYLVEKSLNGIDFQLIGTVLGEAKAIGYYEFTDPTWASGGNQRAYYRLRILEEGKTSLSQIEQLVIKNQPQPQVWPNPAKNVVFLRLAEASTVRMVNVTGKVVMDEQLGRGVQTIPVSHLPAGFYHVEVKSEQGIDRYNIQKD